MNHKTIPCRCNLFRFPHRFDAKRCAVYDELARTKFDEVADDPRRNQAAAINRENAQWKQR